MKRALRMIMAGTPAGNRLMTLGLALVLLLGVLVGSALAHGRHSTPCFRYWVFGWRVYCSTRHEPEDPPAPSPIPKPNPPKGGSPGNGAPEPKESCLSGCVV